MNAKSALDKFSITDLRFLFHTLDKISTGICKCTFDLHFRVFVLQTCVFTWICGYSYSQQLVSACSPCTFLISILTSTFFHVLSGDGGCSLNLYFLVFWPFWLIVLHFSICCFSHQQLVSSSSSCTRQYSVTDLPCLVQFLDEISTLGICESHSTHFELFLSHSTRFELFL